MRPLQMLVAGLCFALNVFDGFDLPATSFTAPAIRNEWGLSALTLDALLPPGLLPVTLMMWTATGWVGPTPRCWRRSPC